VDEVLDMDKCFNAVEMDGGLWPLSRSSFPKQQHQLVYNEHGYTMLQKSF